MGQPFSLECKGKPASALLVIIIRRTKAVSHFTIASDYIEP
jgi:hypothetical protein